MVTKKPAANPVHRNASHPVSLYFNDEDRLILTHCSEKSGLSQSEVVRRLLRIYAAGENVPGMVKIPTHKDAQAWAKDAIPG